MQEEPYVLSIIIPTRNRQKYAAAAVRQIGAIDDRIQIIIHDNSDDDSLKEQLKNDISKKNIIYKYVKNRISAVENYNRAANYATGRYFMALGDDDGILPNIMECILWMERNNIDAVKPSKRLSYVWPNKELRGNKKHGYLWITPFSGATYLCDTKAGIIQLLKNGGQGYLDLSIIGSYHCLVRLECMKRVYAITNKYYGGCSPDIYSAVCLSLLKDIKCVEIDFPITLPGVCPSSTSADAMAGKHIGKLEDVPHFINISNYKWEEAIPRYYTVETVWAETTLKAIKDMGEDELIHKYFNQNKLIELIIKNNRFSDRNIVTVLGLPKNEEERYIRKYIFGKNEEAIRRLGAKTIRKFKLLLRKETCIFKCKDIQKAISEMEIYLNSKVNRNNWNFIISQDYSAAFRGQSKGKLSYGNK